MKRLKKLNVRELRILAIVIAIWAIALICVGKSMDNKNNVITKKTYSINITKKQNSSAQQKTIDIILKDLEIEEKTPLSTNAKDYLENSEILSEIQLKQLSDTLDTSEVNITQPGKYKYTLTYKKKKKTGTITVKEKELPNVTFTVKQNYPMTTTGTISRDVKEYINEKLDEEVYKNMILDISEVVENASTPGIYKYSITYKGTVYCGTVNITPPVVTTSSNSLCPEDANYDKMVKTCICKDNNFKYDTESKKCIKK